MKAVLHLRLEDWIKCVLCPQRKKEKKQRPKTKAGEKKGKTKYLSVSQGIDEALMRKE